MTRTRQILGPRVLASGDTHEGSVRFNNEDAILCENGRPIWVVADGMGGHARGGFASATVIAHMQAVRHNWPTARAFALDIFSRLEEANLEIHAAASAAGALIGTTVAGLAAYDGHALAFWVGDSRIYRIRSSGRLRRVSQDHTIVQQMIGRGEITEAEARDHPSGHVLTRAIGTADMLEPDYRELSISPGDRFLLCSDGVGACWSETDVERILLTHAQPAAAVDALVQRGAASGAATDNISAIVVDMT